MKQVKTEWSRSVLQKLNNNFLGQFFLFAHIKQIYLAMWYSDVMHKYKKNIAKLLPLDHPLTPPTSLYEMIISKPLFCFSWYSMVVTNIYMRSLWLNFLIK